MKRDAWGDPKSRALSAICHPLMKQLLEYRALLLDRLARQSAELAEAITIVPAAGQHQRRVADGYTLHQILAHIRDLELLAFVPRLRRLLMEDHPVLDAFPSHHWSEADYQPDEATGKILNDFAQAREAALALLRLLPPEGWNRAGFHPPSGPRTAQWWAERMYVHAQEHLDEMRQALKTVNG